MMRQQQDLLDREAIMGNEMGEDEEGFTPPFEKPVGEGSGGSGYPEIVEQVEGSGDSEDSEDSDRVVDDLGEVLPPSEGVVGEIEEEEGPRYDGEGGGGTFDDVDDEDSISDESGSEEQGGGQGLEEAEFEVEKINVASVNRIVARSCQLSKSLEAWIW